MNLPSTRLLANAPPPGLLRDVRDPAFDGGSGLLWPALLAALFLAIMLTAVWFRGRKQSAAPATPPDPCAELEQARPLCQPARTATCCTAIEDILRRAGAAPEPDSPLARQLETGKFSGRAFDADTLNNLLAAARERLDEARRTTTATPEPDPQAHLADAPPPSTRDV